jgi:hypothetical protein
MATDENMATRLRVFLTRDQDKTLFKLRTADVPQKVKDRAEVIRFRSVLTTLTAF